MPKNLGIWGICGQELRCLWGWCGMCAFPLRPTFFKIFYTFLRILWRITNLFGKNFKVLRRSNFNDILKKIDELHFLRSSKNLIFNTELPVIFYIYSGHSERTQHFPKNFYPYCIEKKNLVVFLEATQFIVAQNV